MFQQPPLGNRAIKTRLSLGASPQISKGTGPASRGQLRKMRVVVECIPIFEDRNIIANLHQAGRSNRLDHDGSCNNSI
jgi:hypothetical protein